MLMRYDVDADAMQVGVLTEVAARMGSCMVVGSFPECTVGGKHPISRNL
jgi:hypothetical protein